MPGYQITASPRVFSSLSLLVCVVGIEPTYHDARSLLGERASLHDDLLVVPGASATLWIASHPVLPFGGSSPRPVSR